MEENKDKKCEENCSCEKCSNCPMHCAMCKCKYWSGCPLLRKFIWVVVMLAIFCIGVQLGELRSAAREYHYRGDMMGWNYKYNYKPMMNLGNPTPTDTTPTTPIPEKE